MNDKSALFRTTSTAWSMMKDDVDKFLVVKDRPRTNGSKVQDSDATKKEIMSKK